MSDVTPQSVQAAFDSSQLDHLFKATSTYGQMVKKHGPDWKKWPTSAQWYMYLLASEQIYHDIGLLEAPGASPLPPIPPSPTVPGIVDFDGRASKFAELYTSGVGDYGLPGGNFSQVQKLINPLDGNLWTALAFRPGVIVLEPNSRYNQVYHGYGRTGVVNPWNGSGPTTAAGQTSIRQGCNNGRTRFYSMAVRVDHWNGPVGDLFYCDLGVFGYQTSSNDQCTIALGRGADDKTLSYSVQVNGGQTGQNGYGIVQGNAPGTTNFKEWVKPVVFKQWEEFIYEIKWSASTKDGYVKIYNRPCPNDVSGSWKQIYEKDGIDNLLWGDIKMSDGSIQTFPKNPDPDNFTIIDKAGIYFTEYGGEAEDYIYNGLHICDNLELAKASFPA